LKNPQSLKNPPPLPSLAQYRSEFHIPPFGSDELAYFAGNSLGLMPRTVRAMLEVELNSWQEHAVEGHFRGLNPWMHYHHLCTPSLARITGAEEDEVVCTNSLTTNLHLLMVSFFRPTNQRNIILMESGAFPSDQYAVETQLRFHGLNPADCLVELRPAAGRRTLSFEQIRDAIHQYGNRIALVLMPGVQYQTGQVFDISEITRLGHAVGAVVGFDLAHAVGNINLKLHEWGPDFAVWCSYKYLNSGPGGPGGLFVHQRHAQNPDLPRFAGWWGHDESSRFEMQPGFKPMHGAAGWQLSNAPVLGMAAHRASLEIFDRAGMEHLQERAADLSAYLRHRLDDIQERRGRHAIELITPKEHGSFGCQQSFSVGQRGEELLHYLQQNGVLLDFRRPDILRMAPVPLYNQAKDIDLCCDLIDHWLEQHSST
jgi:kynureninase